MADQDIYEQLSPEQAQAINAVFRRGLTLTAAWYERPWHRSPGRRILVRADPSDTPRGVGTWFDRDGNVRGATIMDTRTFVLDRALLEQRSLEVEADAA